MRAGIVSLLLLCLPVVLPAEDTRTEEISKEKAEKSKHLKPYVETKAERYLRIVERSLTMQPVGWYPFFGSVYTGGLFAAGPGYRRPVGDTAAFDIHGAWSLENYRMVDTSFKLPDFDYGRLSSILHARYMNAGKVPFYGLGNDSQESNKTSFGYFPFSYDFTASYRPVKFVTVGGGVGYLKVDGNGPRELADVTPGAGSDPVYTIPVALASFDWRQGPGYTTRGGLYRAEWRDYIQHGENDLYGFHWFEAEASQFIPILRANQVIALDALTTITDTDADRVIPFYMMPRLGGSHYLRGFASSRFRDRDRLYMSAEYRWTPSKFLDVALYYEAGKVASTTDDLDFNDLHSDYGIGFRFHSPGATMLRIELAHSNEATRFIFTVGPAF